jgi:hypothetical protein
MINVFKEDTGQNKMTFQNPLQTNDCAEDYQDSHLDYLCVLGKANDIEVEEAILVNCLNKLGFDPSKLENLTIHIPSQLLEYGSDEPENSPQCGIDESLILNRKIDDVILRFEYEYLKWEFFLTNPAIPDNPSKVTIEPSGEYSIGGKAFKERMSIDCLELCFDTTDSSTLWRLQVSCGSHWFDWVCCKISFAQKVNQKNDNNFEESIGFSQESSTKTKTKLESLGLSIRVFMTLKRRGFKFIEDIESIDDSELMTIKGFGPLSLNEVKTKLRNYSRLKQQKSESFSLRLPLSVDWGAIKPAAARPLTV